MKRYVSRMARKARNAIGARRRRGVRRGRKPLGVSVPMVGYKRPISSVITREHVRRARAASAGARRYVRARRRGMKKGSGGGDTVFMNRRWRGYRSRQSTVVKTLAKQMVNATLRWQAVNRQDGARLYDSARVFPGYLQLSNWAQTTEQVFPVHIFHLTGCGDADPRSTQVGYDVRFNPSLAGVKDPIFTIIRPQLSDGTTASTANWAGERINRATWTVNPGRYVKTGWIDIKMNLYGCTDQPTLYTVQLVKFSNEYLCPESAPSAADDQANYRARFWQNLCKPLTYNPIMPQSVGGLKGMTVLRSYRRLIQPKNAFSSSGDNIGDGSPHNTILRIKYYDGVTRDHQWSTAPADLMNEISGNGWQEALATTATMNDLPRGKARLYLLVKAMNTTATAFIDENARNTPSYDMVIRRGVQFSELSN